MKYLALSLLRLGDLIMHAHVLKALKDQKNAEIHLLTHPFIESISYLFPFVEKTHFFKRDQCQKSIGEPFFNKAWAFHHVHQVLNDLNGEYFDKIIDLTHTDTSARWLTEIDAPSREGVIYQNFPSKKVFSSINPFFHYLHSSSRSEVHFIDLFIKAAGLELPPLPKAFAPHRRDNVIVFQTMTSDRKKNWPLSSWSELLRLLSDWRPNPHLIVLAGPGERQRLREGLGELPKNCEILETSMSETYHVLRSASLLVTLDTSIKHLATWSETPILEIALGSSNPKETGAYQEDAWIITPPTACSPCRHSQNCSQKSLLCQDSLKAEFLAEIIRAKIDCRPPQLKHSHTKGEIPSLFYTHRNQQGWWALQKIDNNQEERHARRYQESNQIHL